MAYQTMDGQPPMSLAMGGSNEIPPQILEILKQQTAQQQMAQQASAMPTINQQSPEIMEAMNQANVIAAKMNAFKQSGMFDTPYQRGVQAHPIIGNLANGAMAFGQGLTKQPYWSDFHNNQTMLQKQNMDNMATLMKTSETNPLQQLSLGMRQDQFDQRQWTQLINKINPATASSRSTLGMTANGNLRANRALAAIKDNPVVTFQDLGNIVGDLAGIYQGGAPTDMGMKHQQYDSIQTRIANMKQFLTGKPQDAVPPAIKEKIISTIDGLKKVNNDSLRSNLDAMENAQKKLIEKYPEEWSSFRKQVESDYMDGGNTQQGRLNSTITMTSPSGKRMTFSADQAEEAKKNGWK